MKLRYRGAETVTVMTAKGNVRFINGIFETEDTSLIKELAKNKNIEKIEEKEEKTKISNDTELEDE